MSTKDYQKLGTEALIPRKMKIHIVGVHKPKEIKLMVDASVKKSLDNIGNYLLDSFKEKRTHGTPEQTIQKEIIDMWETFGAVVVKVNQAGIRKPDGSHIPPRTLGVADLLIGYKGLFISMEVKVPGGKATPAQLLFQVKVDAAGCIGTIVYSLDEAMKVKEYADNKKYHR